ncbi:M12 family metallo-peptidase [Streptomyces cylindrosporus]|uniref:M12 family metallo-peptidase n=1 Tax=Streptomyces cylindrosporus TaxID=2927583 RepID=A0ABS9YSC2_9ACTN|nr:M12 family metallo-peptidase [Streptomyces cylindrosporus]MCI3279151.1 M12 family metallo-peptidase [Streptomyces cylindrosporus]
MPLPARTTRTRRHTLAAAVIAALAAVLGLLAAPHAHAATTTPVYKGTGWKAWTSNGIYSLAPDGYTIVFADATARTRLTPYLKGPAGQVTTAVGVPITVSTIIDTTPAAACPPRHRIVVHYTYRPMGLKGMSQTRACHNTVDGSAWGGHILIDTEYWSTTAWFSTDPTVNNNYRKDTVAHELGHALGLDHPNADLNKDGTITSGECVKSTAGRKPVMCSKNRGAAAAADAGRYTAEYDLPGLRQLLRNYALRQL